MICKHCKKEITLPHECPVAQRTITEDHTSDFLFGLATGMSFGSAEGLLGDALHDSFDTGSSIPDTSTPDFSGGGGNFGGGGSDGSW